MKELNSQSQQNIKTTVHSKWGNVGFGSSSSEIEKGCSPLNSTVADSKITNPLSWNNNPFTYDKVLDRLENCKLNAWMHVRCRRCGVVVKKNAVRGSCLLSYCTDPECIENRINIRMAQLRALNWKTSKLYHFQIAFKPIEKITHKDLLIYDRIIRSFAKLMPKLYKKFYAVAVLDINLSEEKYRVHYHIGALPVKDFHALDRELMTAVKLLSERFKTPVDVNLGKYSKKSSVFHYFAKRCAGLFGHIHDGTRFFFKDLMDFKEYHKNFYRSIRMRFINTKIPSRRDWVYNMIDEQIKKCPFCGSQHFKFTYCEERKPPDPKFCPKCQSFIDPIFFDYTEKCCNFCSQKLRITVKKRITECREYLDSVEKSRINDCSPADQTKLTG